MLTPSRAIETYLQAKDGNRPDLLRHCFTPAATLQMQVKTGAISFPPHVQGRAKIADILVRRFAQEYENVYTFCFGEPPVPGATLHRCRWLVGMSVKSSGELRVGCGEYHWQFLAESAQVSHLGITIEHMQACPPQYLEPLMDWLQRLEYPWCQPADVAQSAPRLQLIEPILAYLVP